MLKHRLIPILLLQNGMLVRSEKFTIHQVVGDPIHEVKRFNEWNVDELIYLDISRSDHYDLRREDHKVRGLNERWEILREVSRHCFMPLAWGGRLKTVDEIRTCLGSGADKITINSEAVRSPGLITEAAKLFGSQAVVVSIDVSRTPEGPEVYIDGGRIPVKLHPVQWAKQCEQLGAGEILLQVIERDGAGTGYDLDLIHEISSALTIPLIACSGAGRFEHYAPAIKAGASAVAAANLWHFKEFADRLGKRALQAAGVSVRL